MEVEVDVPYDATPEQLREVLRAVEEAHEGLLDDEGLNWCEQESSVYAFFPSRVVSS